jgi:hypothetical protein
LEVVIPVQLQPEPPEFDKLVRQPGQRWITKHQLNPHAPLPQGTKCPDYWCKCLDDLYHAYGGICAYASMYIDRVTGARSTDHFVAKKSDVNLAYEWDNYRLACSRINTQKGTKDDIFDPFLLAPNTFFCNPMDGSIFVNPGLDVEDKAIAQNIIMRLLLDDPIFREARLEYIDQYLQNADGPYLLRKSPFVYYELQRQGFI